MPPIDDSIRANGTAGPLPDDPIERSAERRRRRTQQRKRRSAQVLVGALAGVGVVLLAAGGIALGWSIASKSGLDSDALVPARSSQLPDAAVARPVAPKAEPTPYFASRGGVVLRLPVSVANLTEVGFHQAAYSYALALKTQLPDADASQAKKHKGTGRDTATQPEGQDTWLVGSVLRMWRSRPGKPNTAADIGAKAGTPVVAPVTGTVLLVKAYKLYGKYHDYELHIRPDADHEIDCVMIHIDKPVVDAGDRVTAGITPLGVVRKLSDRIHHQLGRYTGEAGDHTHLQLNDATDPKYKGLKDAPPL